MIFLSSTEVLGHDWRGVNQRVLKTAPCSVAVFVDRGFGLGSQYNRDQALPAAASTSTANFIPKKKVCILFLGGPDDRQALELGGRMAQHADVMVTLVRLCSHDHNRYSSSINDIELEKVIVHKSLINLL